jgi:hypothetical protein
MQQGYTGTFKNASVIICDYQEFQILSGARDLDTGIWKIKLRKEHQQPQQAVAHNVYELRNTGVQPYKICLVTGGQKWASHNLARPNGESDRQTFEAHASHQDGAHESKTLKHKVHFEDSNYIKH